MFVLSDNLGISMICGGLISGSLAIVVGSLIIRHSDKIANYLNK